MVKSAKSAVHYLEIPAELDIPTVIKRLKFQGGNIDRLKGMASELAEEIRAVARPKAVFTECSVGHVDRDSVEIGGIRFTSRVLAKKLERQPAAYPFITTVGRELDGLEVPGRDLWRRFCLDAMKTVVLISAVEYTTGEMKRFYSIESAALLNPGELEDWPISQQEPLFRLFNGAEARIGVSLTAGGAMKPLKSRSGILFQDSTGFVSCLLCRQKRCPGRRAAFSPSLAKEYLEAD